MVACTPLGLPYQEGTDRPCDLVPVWCEFADVVEEYLIDIANTSFRTASGVPMAKVARTAEQNFAVNGFGIVNSTIEFDTLVVDNDNMVDLSADQIRIFPTRAGVYELDAMVNCFPRQLASKAKATISYSPYVELVTPAALALPSADVWYNNINQTVNIHVFGMLEVTAADLAGTTRPAFSLVVSTEGTGPVPNSLRVISAHLSVTWTAEEVP